MPKRAVFERSRRELYLDVSVGVHIFLVVEQSSLESQSIEVVPRLRYLRCASPARRSTRTALPFHSIHSVKIYYYNTDRCCPLLLLFSRLLLFLMFLGTIVEEIFLDIFSPSD